MNFRIRALALAASLISTVFLIGLACTPPLVALGTFTMLTLSLISGYFFFHLLIETIKETVTKIVRND